MRRRYDYTLYHKSITAEIQATQDRVKYFLGGAHRATNGWYREVLLMNYLKKVLPSNVSINNHGYLNHISFGPDYFVKYWADGNPQDDDGVSCFSFYKLNNLSFGYFISNLIEFIHSTSRGQGISRELRDFLYPMKGGKETERLIALEIKL